MQDREEFSRAKSYAFRLLKIRPRSQKELLARLKQKNFSADVIDKLLEELKEDGKINDIDFARRWVSERIKKPLGASRLIFELKQKGIDKEIIESVINEAKREYPENETIGALLKEKFAKFLNKPIDDKVRRKIQAFLAYRGFSAELISEILEKNRTARL